jgi:hypothetical protein
LYIWKRCSQLREIQEGMSGAKPMKLKMSEIESACGIYGGDSEDLEGVLNVEVAAYPFVLASYQKKES